FSVVETTFFVRDNLLWKRAAAKLGIRLADIPPHPLHPVHAQRIWSNARESCAHVGREYFREH
ncbi:hypothetical protein, partial [Mesorhizobium sp.]|uniref:hypothetical protein n=1 Tax=Mesorhizobium sp. TaxID=1871066 RepID=UPI00257E86DC